MPADPTPAPAPPLPPKYVMDFMGIDEVDWTKYPAYYEAHYHAMAPKLVDFAQSVRDAALREAAEQMPGLTLNEAMHPYDAAWIAASTFKENILALVGTAPKEATRG